ncbi:MAG: OmpA family protein [Sulfuriferula sp.]|nr:OmpA family protein [Sulfuriferula sp.]
MFMIFLIIGIVFSYGNSAAATIVPTKDLQGLMEPQGSKRYNGSFLIYRSDAEYDEIKLPISTPIDKNDKLLAPSYLSLAGRRVALQYILPAGRSPLEALRNYQQAYKVDGFETLYECYGESCGASSINIHKYGLGSLVMPLNYENAIGDNSPAACAGGAFTGNVRYAVMSNKLTGAGLGVMTWMPGDVSVYCDEKEFKKHASVFFISIEPKALQQEMKSLSATELSKSLADTGKVAIYGILFDTNKSVIKPSSEASLLQIAKLMKQNLAIKLHVVGHTDNVGNFTANLTLSRERANAVMLALVNGHQIARERLTANGVASLAPVQSNDNDSGRAKNRRVELVLQ